MAARVVYEGVGGGGDLFKGIKFCLLQRVPLRPRYIEDVKANGGEVVPLEKQANIVIGDHARKDQPVGSISYKFIEECIKSGRILDVKDYPAGPAHKAIRPVGSSQPVRRGRVPFTAEDDRILMKWCTDAERKGLSLKGNVIYEQLEAVNNRHTYQSWRDRWVKHLSMMPRPDEEDDEDQDLGEAEDEPPSHNLARRSQSAAPRVSAQRSTSSLSRPSIEVVLPARLPQIKVERRSPAPLRSGPGSISRSPTPPPLRRPKRPVEPTQINANGRSPAASSPTASPLVQKSAGGNRFTEEETQMLVDAYEDIINIEEDKMIDAWIFWAHENPNHTAQEWRNYFAEYVGPKVEADRSKKISKGPTKLHSSHPKTSTSNATQHESLEVKDSQESSGRTLVTSAEDLAQSSLVINDEKSFRKDVSTFADQWGLEVDFEPIICNRKIPLFRLWQVVESDELGGYEAVENLGLWIKVARRLNFNDFKHPTAAEELRACFKEGILVDYMAGKQELEESLTSSQQEAMVNEQLLGTAATQYSDNMEDEGEEEGDDDLDLPQFTPKPPFNSPSSKRSLESLDQEPSYKRQRVDVKGKGKEREIPSTPEDIINGNHLPRSAVQSSPLKHISAPPDSGDDSDLDDGRAEDDLYLRSSKFQRTLSSAIEPQAPARVQEPETQDFTYSAGQHDEPITIDDLTPSPKMSTAKSPENIRANNGAASSPIPTSSRNDSSTQSQTTSQIHAELRDQIDHHIGLGMAEDIVVTGLLATSGEDTNAQHVMEHLALGQGVPDNEPGVWFYADDEDIQQSRGSVGWERVVRKHGIKGVAKRKRFLRGDKAKALIARRDELDAQLFEERLKQSRQQT